MRRYADSLLLRSDAAAVAAGVELPDADARLPEQLEDLQALAEAFGFYDAADWLRDQRQGVP